MVVSFVFKHKVSDHQITTNRYARGGRLRLKGHPRNEYWTDRTCTTETVIRKAVRQNREWKYKRITNNPKECTQLTQGLNGRLVHDCGNSRALATELLQSCTKPSKKWRRTESVSSVGKPVSVLVDSKTDRTEKQSYDHIRGIWRLFGYHKWNCNVIRNQGTFHGCQIKCFLTKFPLDTTFVKSMLPIISKRVCVLSRKVLVIKNIYEHIPCNGPLTRYAKLRVVNEPGMLFPPPTPKVTAS